MKRLSILLPSVLLFFCFSCKNDKLAKYPDCFADVEATHAGKWGCGDDLIRIQFSETKLLNIQFNNGGGQVTAPQERLTTECQTFDIASNAVNISLVTHANHPDSIYFDYCNDAVDPEDRYGQEHYWSAKSGMVTAAKSLMWEDREERQSYLGSLRIENLVVTHPISGQDTAIEDIVLIDYGTGWSFP